MFSNDLAADITKNGRHGIQLLPDMMELVSLLFADDIALLSDTVVGLQKQLVVLARNAMKLDLRVNLDKTNIVIFRNGGYVAEKEVRYYDGQSISVVNSYKYLGLFLTTRMTFSNAVDETANKARLVS